MDMLGLVATVLGVYIFIHLVTLIVLSARLVKLQFRAPSIVPVARAEAASSLAVLDAARPVLEQQGFRYMVTRRVRSLVVSPSMFPAHTDVYYNAEHDVHAEVITASMPTPRRPFEVYLLNTYADGAVLITVNGLAHVLMPYPRNYIIADAYAPNFSDQLATHLAQRDSFSGQRTDPAQAHALAVDLSSALLPALEQEGSAYRRGERNGEPLYGMRLLAAVKMAWRMRQGAARRKRMDAAVKGADALPQEAAPEVRHAAERIAFVRTLCTLNGMQAPRWFRWSAFFVSAGGFVALGSWWWGLTAALIIGAVVVVHEAGHWLAMKLADFRDVQVFFVPGMGAATSGEKHDASPLTHLAVYLAGPVPGLLLALCAAAWLVLGAVDASAWWYATLGTAIAATFFINLLNLLPVLPLDGGRVVDMFVLGRLPWLRFVFALASGSALLWAGFATGDNVLRGLGIVYFLAMPHQYRMAKVSRDLLRQASSAPQPDDDFGKAAARLFDFLAQPAYRQWSHEAKVAVGQAILPRFLGRLPGARETAAGLAIYVACMVVPLAAMGVLAVKDPARIARLAFGGDSGPQPARAVAAPEDPLKAWRAQREATLAAAAPAQRIEVLAQVADDAYEAEDYDEALRYARMLYEEAAPLPASARERADAALRFANALLDRNEEQEPGQAARLFAEAETNVRARLALQADSADALLLARILEGRINADDKMNALPLRQEIVDLHAANRAQAGQKLPAARLSLARALDQAGQADAAEQQLQAAADDFNHLPLDMDYERHALALNHAWFLMSRQRAPEAIKRIDTYLTQFDNASPQAHLQREAYLVAAVAARMRADWHEVENRTSTIYQITNPGTGNWALDFAVARLSAAPPIDGRATLMLIEAERALGKNDRANELAAYLRKQYQQKPGGAGQCRFGEHYDAWRKAFTEALAENEKRELKCT